MTNNYEIHVINVDKTFFSWLKVGKKVEKKKMSDDNKELLFGFLIKERTVSKCCNIFILLLILKMCYWKDSHDINYCSAFRMIIAILMIFSFSFFFYCSEKNKTAKLWWWKKETLLFIHIFSLSPQKMCIIYRNCKTVQETFQSCQWAEILSCSHIYIILLKINSHSSHAFHKNS